MLVACADTKETSVQRAGISAQEQKVRAFIDAFNTHEPSQMIKLCAEDIKWGYVSQDSHDLAGQGKEQLATEMEAYFQSTPDVRAKAENIIVTGNTVAVIERVYWKPSGKDQEKTQSSIAVYQLSENLIQSVWYYPEQP